MDATIAFIGAGNMARSLIGGLINSSYDRQRLLATDPNEDARQQLTSTLGISALADNHEAAGKADVVVLAVKPQQLQAVCRELADTVQQHKPLIVSIAAGIRSDDIDRWLGGSMAIVRAMPNTPALVGSGASGLYANAAVTPEQKELAENILRAVGITVWVNKETLLDAVTAVSGSGPAYFFLFMEALSEAGERLGLEAEDARLLTLQTALGAARMAMESEEPFATLRQKVTSPGGTTEAALKVFGREGCSEIIDQAAQAAYQRAGELAEQLGRDTKETN
ncbi:pyrroline-5-carboxylate reductase [Sulfurivirga caldicuralii]|uniref:Pyrroline-5-carboxylate reductase n=1 Tax=Sulfurivirga caldicuralii TaxID=364032 RepID=A0A1N6GQ56_9GAMM|nr:pyrroline-5-carboxylate reductase [Sulfurivirga caldicuralii]SIO09628.1 pyrroline-5-carboxylate reductase [Sulfurivirga caldicuralii]